MLHEKELATQAKGLTSQTFSEHYLGDSTYQHKGEKTKTSILGFAVLLTLTFSAIELIGGIWSNSLALIGDAGHMVTDSASLLFALIASKLAQKGADADHSFGHARIEVLVAFINGLIMLLVVAWLFIEAVSRIKNPQEVAGDSVMVIATTGLVINILVAYTLSRDKKNVNTRAALVHVMGDLLGSVAAIIAGAIIYFGGPKIVDPLLSMLVGILLLHATYAILRDSSRVLLDSVPEKVEFSQVGEFISEHPEVSKVHDLHIWTMSPGQSALQCHVEVSSPKLWPQVLDSIRTGIKEKFGIDHITIQPEWKRNG